MIIKCETHTKKGLLLFSCSVVSSSLWPLTLQPARPPCPSPAFGVCSNSRPSCQWCHPTVSSSVVPFSKKPSIFSSIRIFSSESAFLTRWPEYWSFSFSICPFNEYSGLVSFRTDWLDLLAVQGIFKSLLCTSLKSPVLCCKQGVGVKRWNWTDGPGHITFVGHCRKRGFDSSEVSLCLWWPTLSLWCT